MKMGSHKSFSYILFDFSIENGTATSSSIFIHMKKYNILDNIPKYVLGQRVIEFFTQPTVCISILIFN